MKKWEYNVVFVRDLDKHGSLESTLQRLGREGWEIVSAVGDDWYFSKIIFKRELVEVVNPCEQMIDR